MCLILFWAFDHERHSLLDVEPRDALRKGEVSILIVKCWKKCCSTNQVLVRFPLDSSHVWVVMNNFSQSYCNHIAFWSQSTTLHQSTIAPRLNLRTSVAFLVRFDRVIRTLNRTLHWSLVFFHSDRKSDDSFFKDDAVIPVTANPCDWQSPGPWKATP